MKSTIFFLLWTTCALSAYGQGVMPSWIQNPPARTQGIGLTEEAATKKAFAMAILESAFAIGIPVDIQKMEQLEGDSLLVEASRYVKIPINKVCQHTRELTTRRGYRVYILCQVANDVHEQPKFRSFNCITNQEE